MFSRRLSILSGALKFVPRQIPVVGANLYNEDDVDIVQKAWSIPWEPYHFTLPKEDLALQLPLLLGLDQLNRGSMGSGVPTRIWPPRPRHYQSVDENIPPIVFAPFDDVDEDVPADENTYGGPVIPAPQNLVPLRPICAALEASTGTDFMPRSTRQSAGSSYQSVDENIPPIVFAPFDDVDEDVPADENTYGGPVIPAPQNRGTREPFAVLHYDEEATPHAERIRSREKSTSSSPASEAGSEASSSSAKGWARLRPKAPPAVKIISFGDRNAHNATSEAGPSETVTNASPLQALVDESRQPRGVPGQAL